jgi:hypothetical protein
VGRFREEADKEFLAASEEAFGEALEAFGYAARSARDGDVARLAAG